jgi:phosphatidylglycerophosphatase A
MKKVVLWLAQGFGVGRIPFAPGTFGSMVGLLWLAVLLMAPNAIIFGAALVLGVIISVFVNGRAEKILGQEDPGSVVLDEIVAVPICFSGWIAILFLQHGVLPSAYFFFSQKAWPITLGIFAAFRLFDILKPWPIRQSQSLPGGWGVTTDDVLAALYVNLCVLAGWWVLNLGELQSDPR